MASTFTIRIASESSSYLTRAQVPSEDATRAYPVNVPRTCVSTSDPKISVALSWTTSVSLEMRCS